MRQWSNAARVERIQRKLRGIAKVERRTARLQNQEDIEEAHMQGDHAEVYEAARRHRKEKGPQEKKNGHVARRHASPSHVGQPCERPRQGRRISCPRNDQTGACRRIGKRGERSAR